MTKKGINALVWGLILLFAGSIFWINFHSAFWYDMDMALNAHEAKMMWEQQRLFPDGWVFGNQYQIVDTINVAALFYGLVHQSTLALALASSLGMLLILAALAWCLSPFVDRKGLTIGLLCLIGGTIFGYSAASYTKGLQVLYTMGAYYAWYLIVFLLTAGVWLRLKEGMKVHWSAWIILLALNFGIGMNSLREVMILGLPLLALAAIIVLFEKKPSVHFIFATLVFVAEMSGYLVMKSIPVPTSANMSAISLNLTGASLLSGILNSTRNLLRISGIALAKDGWAYLPLTICAALVAAAILTSIYLIFKRKDRSGLARVILLCALSLLGVYAAGCLFFKTRDIYFFLYWLLAALSVVYVAGKHPLVKWVVAGIALLNYGYQFTPDFVEYHRHGREMKAITSELVQQGYTTLYGDDCTVFAAASKDRIAAAPIRLNPVTNSAYPLIVFPYNKDLSLYGEAHQRQGLVCISNFSIQSETDGALPQGFSEFSPLASLRWGKRLIWLYRPYKPFIESVNYQDE